MKYLLTILTLSLLACTAGVYQPTTEEIATANYGPKPAQESLEKLVLAYFQASPEYDPKGADVNDCSAPYQGWKHQDSLSSTYADKFLYGWKTDCDVNVKDASGAYLGEIWETYFIHNGQVVDGFIPHEYKPMWEN